MYTIDVRFILYKIGNNSNKKVIFIRIWKKGKDKYFYREKIFIQSGLFIVNLYKRIIIESSKFKIEIEKKWYELSTCVE